MLSKSSLTVTSQNAQSDLIKTHCATDHLEKNAESIFKKATAPSLVILLAPSSTVAAFCAKPCVIQAAHCSAIEVLQ